MYGHVNQKMEIADDEFLLLWKDIGAALVRIAGQISNSKEMEWQDAIDKFLKDPLTAEAERNVDELLMWYRIDMEVKESVEELKITTREAVQEMKDIKKMLVQLTSGTAASCHTVTQGGKSGWLTFH